MDTTAVVLLGEQLRNFLVKQLAPLPGAKASLGFLGTSVAVNPESFLSGGQFNSARVSQWLDIVTDPLGEVNASNDQAEFTPWTATQLLEAIYSQAMCVAPTDSDAHVGFAKAKSQAMEGLGGATTVSTAPLDWYDPARVPEWPTCTLTASSTTGSGAKVGLGEPPPSRPLWAWRKLETIPLRALIEDVKGSAPQPPAVVAEHRLNAVQDRRFAFAATPMVTAAAASSVARARLAPLGRPASTAQVADLSRASTEARISVDRIPVALISDRAITSDQALRVSQAASDVAAGATTNSVSSDTLSLSLKYQIVALSRAPWWNEFFLVLDDWYVPGCARASMIEGGNEQRVIGVPVALILTSNVSIQANWSASDRAAATSNTHFGPWALSSAQFTSADDARQATLAIPGIQAIACIYRELPALPPQSDPSLAVPADPTPIPLAQSSGLNSPQ